MTAITLTPLSDLGVNVAALDAALANGRLATFTKGLAGGRTVKERRNAVAEGESCPTCGTALTIGVWGTTPLDTDAELSHVIPASVISPGMRGGDRTGVTVTRKSIALIGESNVFAECRGCNRARGEHRVTHLIHARTFLTA